mmetsp:Transcript_14821/g.22178  ORF Transcript_14821/g.22178 Transcript_14821/m.22178 type:complete len:261 (-) Transcript_14821:1422-2204(-)
MTHAHVNVPHVIANQPKMKNMDRLKWKTVCLSKTNAVVCLVNVQNVNQTKSARMTHSALSVKCVLASISGQAQAVSQSWWTPMMLTCWTHPLRVTHVQMDQNQSHGSLKANCQIGVRDANNANSLTALGSTKNGANTLVSKNVVSVHQKKISNVCLKTVSNTAISTRMVHQITAHLAFLVCSQLNSTAAVQTSAGLPLQRRFVLVSAFLVYKPSAKLILNQLQILANHALNVCQSVNQTHNQMTQTAANHAFHVLVSNQV